MKSILSRRPSAALVIACIALFVSLGGVSYGVATGFIDSRELKDNTIRSRDVRNNTLRTFDIRNNEVRGFDIRNSSVQGRDVAFDTLTGDDISEAELGKVPSAGTADTATTAGTVSALVLTKPTVMTEGGVTTVATHGPLKVTATCEADGPTGVAARLKVETTEVNSFAGGAVDTADVDPSDGPVTVAEATDDEATVNPSIEDSTVVAGVGETPDSAKSLSGVVALKADAAGTDTCIVSGHLALEG